MRCDIAGIILPVLIMGCSSCATVYQYNELQSNIAGKPNEPFTLEKDSICLSYSFNDGNANIEIFNNSTKALYLDWSRSSLIIDRNPHPFWVNLSTVDLTTTEIKRAYINRSYTSGVVTSESPVSFIPPGTRLKNAPFNIVSWLRGPKPIDKVEKTLLYERDSSPLEFRSYLLLSFDPSFVTPIVMDHSFWLSEVTQSPKPIQPSQQQNNYTVSTMTEAGSVMSGFLWAIVIMTGVALYAAGQ